MKKRHFIHLLLTCVVCFGVYFTVVCDFINVCYINSHQDEYFIIEAVVVNTYYKARDVHVSTLSFDYNGTCYEKDFSHDLTDSVGETTMIAVNKQNGHSRRLKISIDYIHLVFAVVGPLAILLEHIRYEEDKKKYMERKIKELNSNE